MFTDEDLTVEAAAACIVIGYASAEVFRFLKRRKAKKEIQTLNDIYAIS